MQQMRKLAVSVLVAMMVVSCDQRPVWPGSGDGGVGLPACPPDRRCGDEWFVQLSANTLALPRGGHGSIRLSTDRNPPVRLPDAQLARSITVSIHVSGARDVLEGVNYRLSKPILAVPEEQVIDVEVSHDATPGTYELAIEAQDEYGIRHGAGFRLTIMR